MMKITGLGEDVFIEDEDFIFGFNGGVATGAFDNCAPLTDLAGLFGADPSANPDNELDYNNNADWCTPDDTVIGVL